MADGGQPTPQPPPVIPPVVSPVPPVQPPLPPVQPAVPPAQPVVPPGPMPQLNWSHFKAEFAGKPDEDAEAFLLMINDWIDTLEFPEGVRSPKNLFNFSRRS